MDGYLINKKPKRGVGGLKLETGESRVSLEGEGNKKPTHAMRSYLICD